MYMREKKKYHALNIFFKNHQLFGASPFIKMYMCVCIYIYVIFKSRAGVLYPDLKHETIAECFRPDKARTASFLNVL